MVQLLTPELLYLPPGHSSHDGCPRVCWYLPPGQVLQMVELVSD